MSWRNRPFVMEKSSIFEREIVYLITCFFMLSSVLGLTKSQNNNTWYNSRS